MTHEHKDSGVRVQRLPMAMLSWDDDAYRPVSAEIGDRVFCLRNAVNTLIHLQANSLVLHAQGTEDAIGALAAALEREI
jgi:hypothetical protein